MLAQISFGSSIIILLVISIFAMIGLWVYLSQTTPRTAPNNSNHVEMNTAPVVSVTAPVMAPVAPTRSAVEKTGADTDEQPQPKSMIDEIEALLQIRLMADAQMVHRSIHIHQLPNGMALIEVDGHRFEAVGDITDPVARAFLQKTVQIWEARN